MPAIPQAFPQHTSKLQLEPPKVLTEDNYRHSCNPGYRNSCIRKLRKSILRCHAPVGHHLEPGAVLAEGQHQLASRSITLFGYDDLRLALQLLIVLPINFLAENEHHQIGVLLD